MSCLFLFVCHVRCYNFRLSALWGEHEIIDHPERSAKVLLMKLGAAVRAASAGAARAGFRRGPSESPQPGAVPTRARSSRLKAMGKPKFAVKTLTGHMSHVVVFF